MFFTLTLGDSYFPFLAYSCFPITAIESMKKMVPMEEVKNPSVLTVRKMREGREKWIVLSLFPHFPV